MGKTIIDKVWDEHVVIDHADGQALVYVDRISLHERSGGRMLQGVLDNGRTVQRPDLAFGVLDHIIDTDPGRTNQTKFPGGAEFIGVFRDYAARAGIPVFDIGDARQGIAHVVAAELGVALPGSTFVCGDSHTCTLGGLGALAWGIGVTQGEHALATQTLRQRRPDTMRVHVEGRLSAGVVAKDLILALIGKHGAQGGQNAAIEFCGPTIRSLDIEARMTVCNMAVEFGAWTGLVSPDDTTFEYLADRPYSPSGAAWDEAVRHWRRLASDEDASYRYDVTLDAGELEPQITWGTSPEHVIGISGRVPDPAATKDAVARDSMRKALAYIDLRPGTQIEGLPVEAAFIGSCTNSRSSDLRAAARILAGRRVAPGVRALCVPGSTRVKREAEAEGIDRIFREAGFEWRESGCSLCFYAGGDDFGGATRVISSTNRNFENRQGPGVRTHLASPATVAASAVAGAIADPRKLED